MKRKYNVTIRMGAAHFDAKVKTPTGEVHFDLRNLHKNDLRKFNLQLVRSFREAGLSAA